MDKGYRQGLFDLNSAMQLLYYTEVETKRREKEERKHKLPLYFDYLNPLFLLSS